MTGDGGAPYRLTPGGAWRRPEIGEIGRDAEVVVRAAVARRCRFLRLGWACPEEGDCAWSAFFRDERTGQVYAQPVE